MSDLATVNITEEVHTVTLTENGEVSTITLSEETELALVEIREVVEVNGEGAVSSVNGQTGAVVLDTGDINEADDNLYVSAAEKVSWNAKDTSAITAIRNGVDTAGDDLAKLYALIQALNAIVGGTAPDGDSVTDTVAEILAVMATYPEGVEVLTALNGKVETSAIVNNLLEATSGKVLDARQGKILNDLITALTSVVSGKADTSAVNSALALKLDATKFLSAYKPSQTSRNSTVTLTADPHLSVTVTSGGIYQVKAIIFLYPSAGGIRLDVGGGTATASSYVASMRALEIVSGTDVPFKATEGAFGLDAAIVALLTESDYLIEIDGVLQVDAGGTFTVRWAQHTSNPDAIVMYQGSNIVLTKLN